MPTKWIRGVQFWRANRTTGRRSALFARANCETLEQRVLLSGVTTFSNADLNNNWFLAEMDSTGIVQFDGNGNIAGGSLTHDDGSITAPAGTYSLATDGSLSLNDGGSVIPTGAMNSSKNVVAVSAPAANNSLGVLVNSGTGSFSDADLTGTWYAFYNGDGSSDPTNDNSGHGIFTLDGNGGFSGVIADDQTAVPQSITGSYSVSSNGAFTLNTNTGSSFSGFLDSSKDFAAADSNLQQAADPSNNDTRLLTIVQPTGSYSNADMTGSWTVTTDGGQGTVIFDGAGSLSGTFLDTDNLTETLSGTYVVASNGTFTAAVNTTVLSVTKTLNFAGALNTARNVGVMDQPNDGVKGQDDLAVLIQSSNTPPAPVLPKHTGQLDPTFGVDGVASNNVGFTATSGLAVEPNGQSIIAGVIGSPGSQQFGLTRYNADGSLDTTFGAGGVVSVGFPGTDAAPSSVTLLPSGQILEVGTAAVESAGQVVSSQFALALFDANGTLNTSFGTNGTLLTSFSSASSTDIANAVALGRGGEFFVVGSSTAGGTGTDFAVVAYNSNGTSAGAFNGSGHELLDFSGGNDSAKTAVLQPNGELVVAGSTQNPSTGEMSIALTRLLANGAVDSHFGTKGKIVTNLRGVDDDATSVALQPKGQIVVGGLSATGSLAGGTLATDFAVLRYTSTGKLDHTFAHSGHVITSFGEDAAVTTVLVQSNGQIVASGKAASGFSTASLGQLAIAVARYNTNGTIDNSFNGTGQTLITLNGQSATTSLQRAAAIAPADSPDQLRQGFESFVASAQGILAATQGGNLAVAGNSGGFTEEGQLVAAGVQLAASLLARLPASVKAGAFASVTVTVKDAGSSNATGTVTVELFVSGLSAAGLSDQQLFSHPEALSLKPFKTKSYAIKVKLPASLAAGRYFLFAQVKPNAIQDLNATDNIAFKGPFVIT